MIYIFFFKMIIYIPSSMYQFIYNLLTIWRYSSYFIFIHFKVDSTFVK